MDKHTCCVTGHRDLPAGSIELVRAELMAQARLAVADGYTRFISGFARGVDLMFADAVAELKSRNAALRLVAAIPYRGRLGTPDAEFRRLIEACDDVTVLREEYSADCFLARDRHMLEESARVIAVYDGRGRGGTLYTLRLALDMGRDVRVISLPDPEQY